MTSSEESSTDYAISSVENLSSQISNFVFSKKISRISSIHLSDADLQTLEASFLQMRFLLAGAHLQFTKMADDNRRLAAKIDGSLHDTNEEMMTLKAELQRLSQIANNPIITQEKALSIHVEEMSMELKELRRQNASFLEELEKVRLELQLAKELNQKLTNNNDTSSEHNQLKLELIQLKRELSQSQEMIHTMKADQKKQKAEKLDLLGQMRQLYGTLEDKETELKDFINSYEQRVRESENVVRQMASEKTNFEKSKWELLQKAQTMTDRSIGLKLELDLKDQIIAQLEEQLERAEAESGLGTMPRRQSVSFSGRSSKSEDSLKPKAVTADPFSSHSADNLSPLPEQDDCLTFPRSAVRSENQRGSRKVSWSLQSDAELIDQEERQDEKQDGSDDVMGHSARSKNNQKQSTEMVISESQNSFFHPLAQTTDGLTATELSDEDKKRILAEAKKMAPVFWKANHVKTWLELDVHMPSYGMACAESIKSGRVLLGMSDSELDCALGLQTPIHRRKFRLAIEELRNPDTITYPLASTISHTWVANEWIPSLGLPQFSSTFEAQLVDGRLLNVLTKKDLEKHFSVLQKLHQTSILCGIEFLRSQEFDKRALTERRSRSTETNKPTDPTVWTNENATNWVNSIDLGEYSGKLKNSGVHGALLVDHSFTVEMLAEILGIPTSKPLVVRHLAAELKTLKTNAMLFSSPSNPPKKSHLSRSPFVRSFRGGKATASQTEEANKQGRASDKGFSWRGSIGRAFGKKLQKDQIRLVLQPEANMAKSLSNIDETSRREASSENDRLI